MYVQIELKLKPRNSKAHKFESIMKKYIFILDALELMTKLMVGKRVEGVLFMDENTGRLTFKAYNRQPRVRKKDVLESGAHQGVRQFSQGDGNCGHDGPARRACARR